MDLANLDLPAVDRPDFTDDLTGQIAEYLFDKADGAAMSYCRGRGNARRLHRENRDARRKTHRAWARAISKLQADQKMVSILDNEGLLEPLKKIIKCISQDYEMPDKGGSLPTAPLTMARMAANKFFPDRFGMVEAATLNQALQQAGFITEDMTDTIRATILQERPAREDAAMAGETEKQRDARIFLHDLRLCGLDLRIEGGQVKVCGSARNDPEVLQVVERLEDELRSIL